MPHVHVLGLIHPEICRMEGASSKGSPLFSLTHSLPQNRYMHHNGKWKQKRADGIRFQKMRCSSFHPLLPFSCATYVLLRTAESSFQYVDAINFSIFVNLIFSRFSCTVIQPETIISSHFLGLLLCHCGAGVESQLHVHKIGGSSPT